MRPGPRRDATLAWATERFASHVTVRSTRPRDHLLLHLTAPPDADGDWHEALQLAAYRLEENGIPTLQRSVDPYTGDRVEWVRVLLPAADEAAWRDLAVGPGASVSSVPLGRGVVLFDTVAGTGHGRALFPGVTGAQEWQDWWWSV